VLGRIKPRRPWGDCGGIGAWEIAARYSYIDLNPAAPFSAGGAGLLDGQPPGGALNDATFGLNWYLNANLKVQFNYIRAMLNVADTHSTTNIVALRTQLDF
jgi:phosphate-selective porin OprO/OprP